MKTSKRYVYLVNGQRQTFQDVPRITDWAGCGPVTLEFVGTFECSWELSQKRHYQSEDKKVADRSLEKYERTESAIVPNGYGGLYRETHTLWSSDWARVQKGWDYDNGCQTAPKYREIVGKIRKGLARGYQPRSVFIGLINKN